MGDWLFHFLGSFQGGKSKNLCHFFDIFQLLIALVAYGEPTPSNYYMHDVARPNGAFWGVHGRSKIRPGILPFLFLLDFFCPIPFYLLKGLCACFGVYSFGC